MGFKIIVPPRVGLDMIDVMEQLCDEVEPLVIATDAQEETQAGYFSISKTCGCH